MKRLAVALAAIGLTASLGAYAAMPTGAQASEVNVPQNQGGFSLGASALYWQPTSSTGDLNYSSTQISGPALNTNQQLNNVDPGYNWGFNVFAGYDFGNGNDVLLSYLRLHTDDSSENGLGQHLVGANNATFISPAHYFAAPGPNNSGNNLFDTYQSAKGKAELNLDQADLVVGQYLNIGCADQLHLFGGLRYAQLERKLNSWYSQSSVNPYNTGLGTGVSNFDASGVGDHLAGGAFNAYDDSDYEGIGPLVGLNNNYYLGYGIGFITALDTGLLIGNVSDDLTLNNYQPNTFSPNVTGINITTTAAHTSDPIRVVPVVDAKLGFDYTYPFQNYGSLTLEAGWNVSHYWNAVDGLSADAASNIDPISGLAPQVHTANVGYQGPYVTLTYRSMPTA